MADIGGLGFWWVLDKSLTAALLSCSSKHSMTRANYDVKSHRSPTAPRGLRQTRNGLTCVQTSKGTSARNASRVPEAANAARAHNTKC